MFTEAEIKFLLDQHTVETATGERRLTSASVDLRNLGCPRHIFERILNHRAKQLGARWIQFRNANHKPESEPTTHGNIDSLQYEVEGTKLW